MTRDGQQQPVGGARPAHGPCRPGASDLLGELSIGNGLTERNLPDRFPNGAAELGCGWELQRQSGEIGFQFPQAFRR
jgi:hypothetical protein